MAVAPRPDEIYARAAEEGERLSSGWVQLLSRSFIAGVVLLVVGRSELVTENFLDPVTAVIERGTGWLLRLVCGS